MILEYLCCLKLHSIYALFYIIIGYSNILHILALLYNFKFIDFFISVLYHINTVIFSPLLNKSDSFSFISFVDRFNVYADIQILTFFIKKTHKLRELVCRFCVFISFISCLLSEQRNYRSAISLFHELSYFF